MRLAPATRRALVAICAFNGESAALLDVVVHGIKVQLCAASVDMVTKIRVRTLSQNISIR